jgi:hypothetical protein
VIPFWRAVLSAVLPVTLSAIRLNHLSHRDSFFDLRRGGGYALHGNTPTAQYPVDIFRAHNRPVLYRQRDRVDDEGMVLWTAHSAVVARLIFKATKLFRDGVV